MTRLANLTRSPLALSALAGLAVLAAPAEAKTFHLADTYWGGINTWKPNDGDVIGSAAVFDTASADISRVGPGGHTLRIVINTNYAGKPGTKAALGTGYGALFLTPGANAWSPKGTGPTYKTDVFEPGDWAYAFTIPEAPAVTSGTGRLYDTDAGTIVMSNAGGSTITYPYAGHGGYYFRQGQAVQFTPDDADDFLRSGSWSVGAGKITFEITDSYLLGNAFALSWAPTCGNDMLQGQVTMVPEPGTWAMMLIGFAGLGIATRRRRPLASA